jgi:hypothetical protein
MGDSTARDTDPVLPPIRQIAASMYDLYALGEDGQVYVYDRTLHAWRLFAHRVLGPPVDGDNDHETDGAG